MNITSWAYEVNFIFWASYKHVFSAEKKESQRFYLPLPSQRSLIGIAAKKFKDTSRPNRIK